MDLLVDLFLVSDVADFDGINAQRNAGDCEGPFFIGDTPLACFAQGNVHHFNGASGAGVYDLPANAGILWF